MNRQAPLLICTSIRPLCNESYCHDWCTTRSFQTFLWNLNIKLWQISCYKARCSASHGLRFLLLGYTKGFCALQLTLLADTQSMKSRTIKRFTTAKSLVNRFLRRAWWVQHQLHHASTSFKIIRCLQTQFQVRTVPLRTLGCFHCCKHLDCTQPPGENNSSDDGRK